MIGKKITPILTEIENTLLETYGTKPQYPEEALRAATQIFSSVIMDKMFDLQEKENIPIKNRLEMAEKVGGDIRKLIKTYTNIDSFEFYK